MKTLFFRALKSGAHKVAKTLLRPLIYRYPPIGLQPERLQYWLRSLIETSSTPGDIVEVGCMLGGTAAYSQRMVHNLSFDKRYICIDTFGGFVEEQFDNDVDLGNRESNRFVFADSSMRLVRAILDQLGAQKVELLQGDIASMDARRLPAVISALLLDVDLALPIYEGLKRLYPRLARGGIILVDDCPEGCDWQARRGYERFCSERQITPEYQFGMGVLRAH